MVFGHSGKNKVSMAGSIRAGHHQEVSHRDSSVKGKRFTYLLPVVFLVFWEALNLDWPA